MQPVHRFRSPIARWPAAVLLAAGLFPSAAAATRAAEPAPIRVVVWDERQPEQKQAYENFLGNAIAAALEKRPGIEVRSVGLDDAAQGLAPEIIDFAEVLVWWSHRRQGDVKPEAVRAIVEKVMAGRLMLVALHSAHWATPFTELMAERARADVRREFAAVAPAQLSITEVPLARKVPAADARVTPFTEVNRRADGTVAVTLHLPICVFPRYRNDGKPSTVTVLAPEHQLAAGLPATFTLDRTEMYDEPYHVPAPDTVVCEERWAGGERFRSVMAWKVGSGKVVYVRPGHEIYPVWKDERMLRLLENAIRWQRTAAE
jgi:trehalose utilization protein